MKLLLFITLFSYHIELSPAILPVRQRMPRVSANVNLGGKGNGKGKGANTPWRKR